MKMMMMMTLPMVVMQSGDTDVEKDKKKNITLMGFY